MLARPEADTGNGLAPFVVEQVYCGIDRFPALLLAIIGQQEIELAAVGRGEIEQRHPNAIYLDPVR